MTQQAKDNGGREKGMAVGKRETTRKGERWQGKAKGKGERWRGKAKGKGEKTAKRQGNATGKGEKTG